MRSKLAALLAVLALCVTAVGPVIAKPPPGQGGEPPGQAKKITHKDREAAAARALQKGALNPLMAMEIGAMPGNAPRYFSHPNYANSPLPTIEGVPGASLTVGHPLVDREYATDNAADVFVVLAGQPLPTGFLQGFELRNQATAGGSNQPSAGLSFHAYVLRPTGTANEFHVAFDSGLLTVPPLADPAVSENVSFPVANLAVQAGDLLAFYGRGIPLDVTGTDVVSHPAPTPPLQDSTITLGAGDFPIYPQSRTYSFRAQVVEPDGVTIAGGIRKFVDTLPGLGPTGENNLGQYIPVAVPDTTTYPGADYYEIGLVQYEEQMHSDLAPTLLRGYVQLSTSVVQGAQVQLSNVLRDGTVQAIPGFTGVDQPHYLGPAIVATKNRPVRIVFRNLLPTGNDGNLFIPVDTTVMGSGMAPGGYGAEEMDPQNPMCSSPMKAEMVAMGHCYSEARATLHLHGGITPWISDGTPHQWITPAGEATPYPEGVSVRNVPDMPDPGDGAQTFFYTNQQSARLMFYHDHAWGITRLNVYAGEAAPYIITDEMEQALVDEGVIPGPDATIPLVIQDKTFVPSHHQLMMQDETWDASRWGGEGDLWLPHVYSPAQNPGDSSGVNQYGRWMYGPWFWPPTSGIDHGPIPNPYFDPTCDPDEQWCEPPLMPGTPFNSMGMEAFMDTPVVNGTAYPTVTLDPKAYRFRILNAANDRFWNLSLYEADPNAPTEVMLNAAEVEAALEDPAVVFPTPVAGTEGPEWVQIGTEGGFLPAPVVVPAQPITWVNDPTVFNAGNVDKHSLLLAPAERADVVVDFSQYAGQTLILYNDAPAAFPARDPRYDYYTGSADLTDTGGVPTVLPGYGPNTRTVMQIRIADTTPAPAFDRTALVNAFRAESLGGLGIFENGQHPIIVGQAAYNSAYGTTFKINGPDAGLAQIFDTSLTFKTLAGGASGPSMTLPLAPKQIQDEMGEAYEQEYGRMSGFLGVETPNAQAGLQNMILYPYTFPPSEIVKGLDLPPGVDVTPITQTDDGTQIWKITHNGVDTHPIHFHLYDIQLINRVGWDGIIRRPDPSELGWKDTVRVSPLEDTIVALRPIIPDLPWDLPNSIRLLDPSMPEGAYLANTTAIEAAGGVITAFNPDGEPVDIVNHKVNFGWEYVLHCHILSHEEMDMMRAQAIGVAPLAPSDLTATRVGNGGARRVDLAWTDNSLNETDWLIQRSTSPLGPWTTIATAASLTGDATGSATFRDPIGNTNQTFFYQVKALNIVGDTWDYADPNLNEIVSGGFPTLTMESAFTNVATFGVLGAPTSLTATLQAGPQVRLTWNDTATFETGFVIERSDGTNTVELQAPARAGTGSTTFTDTTVATTGAAYQYRVKAVAGPLSSAWSNTASITVPAVPAAPSGFTAANGPNGSGNNRTVVLNWVDNASNETGFTIQRATNATFTSGVTTTNLAANTTTFTQTGLARNTNYWFRIRANNGTVITSAWVLADPAPIRTNN